MKTMMIWMGVVLAAGTMAQEPKVEPEVVLKAMVDRADALYEVGETVTFRIEGTLGGKAAEGVVVECVISKDGVEAGEVEQVTLKAGKAEVTGSLKEPGFLQMRARSGKASVLAAAGVEPLKLKPSLPVPEDFDSFWKGQKAMLAAVPMKAKKTRVETKAVGVELEDVQVDCVGEVPVSGSLAKPVGAKA